MRVTAARPRLMLGTRESSGRACRESHFRHDTGFDLSLDVVTVEMQRDWPVRTPAQFDEVALLDPDQLRRGGQLAALNAQFECQFVRLHAGGGKARRQEQRNRKEAPEEA